MTLVKLGTKQEMSFEQCLEIVLAFPWPEPEQEQPCLMCFEDHEYFWRPSGDGTHMPGVNKGAIIQKAWDVSHINVYDPLSDKLVWGFKTDKCPDISWAYRKRLEPVVNLDGIIEFNGKAWLTVNYFNCIILSSTNLLVADIDFTAKQEGHVVPTCVEEVIMDLRNIATIVKRSNVELSKERFDMQSYRVYQTHSGCRVICTSMPIQPDYIAMEFMHCLRCDPKYTYLCESYGCYRARLTPKPWREDGCGSHVCNLVETVGSGDVHPDLEDQLALHDLMTLGNPNDSSLA